MRDKKQKELQHKIFEVHSPASSSYSSSSIFASAAHKHAMQHEKV
jgi:hypothetical protein